jgi:DIM1 family U5 snRNP protein
MSYMLPHLHSGWAVDQAILSEEDRVVVIRFGHDYEKTCMGMDESVARITSSRSHVCVALACHAPVLTFVLRSLLLASVGVRSLVRRVLYTLAEDVKNFGVVYLVDISEVPDFNTMYELYDPCTVMFFFRNKHITIDLGTGNNNKINWLLNDKQEMIDIIETVYRGAKKGRGMVVSPKDYSTKYKY